MRSMLLLLSVLLVSLSVAAESTDPQTLLAVRGKLLKEESFKEQAAVDKGNKGGWNIYKGKFEVVDGALKVTEQKEDMHHPAMSTKLPCKDVVMQCKVKLGAATKWMGLSLDNGKAKEHVFRAMLDKGSVSAKRMSGMGATTKGENVAQKKMKIDADKWVTLVVELVDKEVCIQIPELQVTIHGTNDGIAQEKDRFEIIAGGEAAGFDELKIWEATKNPAWDETKSKLK